VRASAFFFFREFQFFRFVHFRGRGFCLYHETHETKARNMRNKSNKRFCQRIWRFSGKTVGFLLRHGIIYQRLAPAVFRLQSMDNPRAAGILLHPTSLPGKFGIGDLGPEAFSFADFLNNSGQTFWQILPLGPTGYGDSPYQSYSAFAGNTLLISPEKLAEEKLLTPAELSSRPKFKQGRVDFGAVYEWKNKILHLAFEAFHNSPDADLSREFETFQQHNNWWLNDYALYRVLKLSHDHKAWYEWPAELKLRDPLAIQNAANELAESVREQKFYQFLFFRQWHAVKSYANGRGVRIIGDVPIFVALDSADVWCNRDKFKLNADGSPRVVAGVPPDYFSKTGQLWGNPIYDWDKMRNDDFQWWAARIAFTLGMVDVIRLDHFRGFSAAWEVPGTDETAENGAWVDVPGRELFSALRRHLGDLPVIAEDLGFITPDVTELRDSFEFPGMKVLQFAFGGDAHNQDLPHNYMRNCVAYTGTHDNDTTIGWWHSAETRPVRSVPRAPTARPQPDSAIHLHCKTYLNTTAAEINWDLVRAAWASVAQTAIAPLQDVLGLGSEARMNLPASTTNNWTWRFGPKDLTEKLAKRLKDMTNLYARAPR